MASLLHIPREWADDESEDEFFSESDVEQFSDLDDDQADKYYFISKSHLRSVQTMKIALSSADLTFMEMDAALDQALMGYNYSRVFGILHEHFESVAAMQLRARTRDDYQAFHCAAGSILRGNKPTQLALLDRLCRDSEVNLANPEVASLLQAMIDEQREQNNLSHYLEAKEQFNKDLIARGMNDIVESAKSTIDGGPLGKKCRTMLIYQNHAFEGLGTTFEESEMAAAKSLCEHVEEAARFLGRIR